MYDAEVHRRKHAATHLVGSVGPRHPVERDAVQAEHKGGVEDTARDAAGSVAPSQVGHTGGESVKLVAPASHSGAAIQVHKAQHEGVDELDAARIVDVVVLHGAHHLPLPEQPAEELAGAEGSTHLHAHVADHDRPLKLLREAGGQGYRRIEVTAGDGIEGIAQGAAHGGDGPRSGPCGLGEDSGTRCEDKQEGARELGQEGCKPYGHAPAEHSNAILWIGRSYRCSDGFSLSAVVVVVVILPAVLVSKHGHFATRDRAERACGCVA
mmetsp:Transcript_71998/g.154036  ORF Transcript_71998/g.154036 Transcript_71998/m.154036 type:complete len:267 (+) Transcript_71998:831-1631(+)